ncbi:chondroitinase-B domain-containing protein [Algibacter sp. 2305UL17-15]|uniref:chondroitinase-B domain-containing protein n=1 Tax=Algibacter sp. 2305UL17-15 TaxID=3231268 RepID=UPI0034589A1A
MRNYIYVLILLVFNAHSQVVSNNAELQNAISNATAGSTIILTNGVWNDISISINKTGTLANPITIKAQNVGQVFLEGNPHISLGGQYIILEGFVFQNPSNLVASSNRIDPIIEFRDASNNECSNCIVTNIKIDSFNGTASQDEAVFKWTIVYGQYNEISHSSFIGKNGVGSIINDNRNDSNPDYTKIHHNYFADRVPVDNEVNGLNDQDAIRIGNSSTSLSDSFTEVYDNLFNNWSGEVEIISNKSGSNKYYNNTFRDYQGTLTLRHGNNTEVFGNYFFGNNNPFSGGVRIIGEDHKVFNNYFEGLNYKKPNGSGSNATGGINVSNGKPDSELNEYYQVKNVQIVNNTLVNCDLGIRVGTVINNSLTLAPENVTIANNIMLNSSDSALQEITAPTGTSKYEGNITQNGTWDLTNGVNSNQTVVSGLLTSGTDFYRLPLGSPAIDAGIGNYPFLTSDILNSTRPTSFDAGAEEYGGTGTNLPYKAEDVSVKVGFLSSPTPYISLSTNTLNFNNAANSSSFDIGSNLIWTVSDNADWISLSAASGSNAGTITVNVLENTTGSVRAATVTVSEIGGGLSASLTVNQSDTTLITGINVTGVGTQNPNIPENTLDENTSTRWSANSEDGSAYLTYDIQCQKTISSVKIYFHKGNIRTSSFKIATSNDGTNFTDATSILTSSGTTIGFEEFPLATNPTVQYLRILGYGNSEGSGWNSYEEVEIYGNNTCAPLSIEDHSLKNSRIAVYPVPSTDGYISITSENNTIGLIKIYDIQGKLLHAQNIQSKISKIDISNFSSGVYVLKTDKHTSRFVVE